MVAQVVKLNETELFFQPENGILTEQQIEAFLLGWLFRVTRTRDRRGSTTTAQLAALDATPNAVLSAETGLPHSANALLPKHRAISGPELALSLVIPPTDWVTTIVYTDDLAENANVAQENRQWRALSFKPPGSWSDEELLAVSENTRRLKRIVHRLSEKGLFVTKPKIDDSKANFGTDELVHGEDQMTMGFAPTYDGIKYAEEFARLHPRFMHGHTLLDAMGPTLAQKAPDWLQQDLKHAALAIG